MDTLPLAFFALAALTLIVAVPLPTVWRVEGRQGHLKRP